LFFGKIFPDQYLQVSYLVTVMGFFPINKQAGTLTTQWAIFFILAECLFRTQVG